MDLFSSEDLCEWLDKKIDPFSIEQLKGRLLAIIVETVQETLFVSLVNEIDGKTLMLLVNDVEEFGALIPKVVSRLKIKKLVREFSTREDVSHSFTF